MRILELAGVLAVASALWAFAPSASAQATSSSAEPVASAASPRRASAAIAVQKKKLVRRPFVAGAICALFLLVGAYCGRTDRPGGDEKRPKSPA